MAAAEELCNILLVERDNGLALPEWTKSVFPEKMLPLAERRLEMLTETPYMKLVKAGPLLTEIVRQMSKKRNKELSITDSGNSGALAELLGNQYGIGIGDVAIDRRIAIYSGHDVTLASLTRGLNVVEQTSRKPDYGAALGIEMHQGYNDQDDFEIKVNFSNTFSDQLKLIFPIKISQQLVYYFNSDDKVPTPLTIPNCEVPCTFARFVESIKELLVPDFADACKLD